jgi:hypothetical protein
MCDDQFLRIAFTRVARRHDSSSFTLTIHSTPCTEGPAFPEDENDTKWYCDHVEIRDDDSGGMGGDMTNVRCSSFPTGFRTRGCHWIRVTNGIPLRSPSLLPLPS